MSESQARRLSGAALLAVAACWGSSYVLVKDLQEQVGVFDLLAVRFPISALALLVLFPAALWRLPTQSAGRAVVLGLCFAGGHIFGSLGLTHTSASVSGFVTALFLVFTPLLAWLLLGVRVGGRTCLAVVLAAVGVGLLTLGGATVGFGYGEGLTVLSAVFYALHVVGLSVWSRPGETLGSAVVQLGTVSVVCLVGAAPGGIHTPESGAAWSGLLYLSLAAGALAIAGQTFAQARIPATRCALILTLEPVFAASFAVLVGGETGSPRLVLGGLVVIAGLVLLEVPVPRLPVVRLPRLAARRPVARLAAVAVIASAAPVGIGVLSRAEAGEATAESDAVQTSSNEWRA